MWPAVIGINFTVLVRILEAATMTRRCMAVALLLLSFRTILSAQGAPEHRDTEESILAEISELQAQIVALKRQVDKANARLRELKETNRLAADTADKSEERPSYYLLTTKDWAHLYLYPTRDAPATKVGKQQFKILSSVDLGWRVNRPGFPGDPNT